MPISARVEGDGTMPAAGAFIEMTAENGGTTPCNGQQHFAMLPAKPLAVSFDEGGSCSADQIGQLECRPIHLLLLRRPVFELQRIKRTRGGIQMALREVQVDGGFFQI